MVRPEQRLEADRLGQHARSRAAPRTRGPAGVRASGRSASDPPSSVNHSGLTRSIRSAYDCSRGTKYLTASAAPGMTVDAGDPASLAQIDAILGELRVCLGELRCVGSERMVKQGVSMTHLHVLSLLDHHGELTMSRLADLLDVSLSNATGWSIGGGARLRRADARPRRPACRHRPTDRRRSAAAQRHPGAQGRSRPEGPGPTLAADELERVGEALRSLRTAAIERRGGPRRSPPTGTRTRPLGRTRWHHQTAGRNTHFMMESAPPPEGGPGPEPRRGSGPRDSRSARRSRSSARSCSACSSARSTRPSSGRRCPRSSPTSAATSTTRGSSRSTC